jgi:hypothetical protein
MDLGDFEDYISPEELESKLEKYEDYISPAELAAITAEYEDYISPDELEELKADWKEEILASINWDDFDNPDVVDPSPDPSTPPDYYDPKKPNSTSNTNYFEKFSKEFTIYALPQQYTIDQIEKDLAAYGVFAAVTSDAAGYNKNKAVAFWFYDMNQNFCKMNAVT